MPELGLGTVAFGFDYGITNTQGAPTDDVALGILDTARRAGITLFDTAADYGRAQQRLGDLTSAQDSDRAGSTIHRRYVTKFSLATNGADPTRENVFGQSMNQLKVERLEGVLFHKLGDLDDKRCERAVRILREGRESGTVSRIGVSAYNENDLEHALDIMPDLDVIQLPANIFDRKLLDSALVTELVSRNVHVHVRSAFLQGLFFAHPNDLPSFFAPLDSSLRAIREEATRHSVTVQSIALSALKFHPNVSAVIVGAQSPSELSDIISAWSTATAAIPIGIDLSDIPPAVLDPRQWPSTKVSS
jgi:aryl-alcohol dehydrogenase-like predicted oxidoreductase